MENFFTLYRPLVDSWQLYDNTNRGQSRLMAFKRIGEKETIVDEVLWSQINQGLTR